MVSKKEGKIMEQLAIMGGSPVRSTPISYGRHYIDDDWSKNYVKLPVQNMQWR